MAKDQEDREDERTQVVNDLVERFRRLGYRTTKVGLPSGQQVEALELEERVSSVLRATFGDDVAAETAEDTEED
ncbi:MAG TPA: hypothetical protein VE078_13970 [Thermoanaerobaculia bacterium]|nr:hypothetical protein [Thermoanaerobaculia bacterium]